MDDHIPLQIQQIPVTRLDPIPLTILDDIQSQMDPNELVNRVFMMQSVQTGVPINELIDKRKY